MVCVVRVLTSYLVCHRVVFLVHCCTLLTFQGYFRMIWLVMLTTLPCFVGFHILVIGHLWQHHWMMIWLWSTTGAVGGVCYKIQERRGGCLFLVSNGWAFVPRLGDWWLCSGDGLWVEDFGCHSWFQVLLLRGGLVSWGRQWVFFRDVAVVAKCFWAFILPVLEYCSPVWMSAVTSHLSLLDRVVS